MPALLYRRYLADNQPNFFLAIEASKLASPMYVCAAPKRPTKTVEEERVAKQGIQGGCWADNKNYAVQFQASGGHCIIGRGALC